MCVMPNIVKWSSAVWLVASPLAAEQVRMLNWTDFIATDPLIAFEEDTGVAVRVDTYLESDEAEGILLARNSGYDLAIVATEVLPRLVQGGAVAELSSVPIEGRARLDQGLWDLVREVMPRVADYGIPYAWGTTGLAMDVAAVTARIDSPPLDSWALVLDPENAKRLADCGISIVNSSEEVVPIVLSYLGLSPTDSSEADLDAAFAVLSEISPYVRYFDTNQFDTLANQEVCVAVTWSSEGLVVFDQEHLSGFDYVLPKEGSNVWADVFVIPVDAGNRAGALALLRDTARPENVAAHAEWVFGVVRNEEVRAHLDAAMFDRPALRLPEEALDSLYVVPPRDGTSKRALQKRWRDMMLGL